MSFIVTLHAEEDKFKGLLQINYKSPFRLRGDWEVCVYSCHASNEKGEVWLFSNVVDFSYVNEVPMQLLGVVDLDKPKMRPLYVKVARKTISTINIEVKSGYNSEVINSKTAITCILHFRKS
jgi:hypothetical protein